MKRTLLFTAIMSILTLNAHATSATVTSRDYVDAQDALKQDLIPEAGVNAEENGGGESVVTYTDEEGVLGERGICEDSTDNCNQADIATFGLVGDVATNINNNMETNINTNINNAVDYLINVNNNNNDITNMANTLTSQSLTPVVVQSPLACAKMENNDCVLWSIGGSAIVHKLDDCKTDQDCPNCDSGFMKRCDDGLCKCIYGACSTASDCNCASGMIASCANNVCACNQCNTASDCSCGSGMTASCVNNACRCDVCKVDGTLVSNGSQCCSGRNDHYTHICCGTPGSGSLCSEK